MHRSRHRIYLSELRQHFWGKWSNIPLEGYACSYRITQLISMGTFNSLEMIFRPKSNWNPVMWHQGCTTPREPVRIEGDRADLPRGMVQFQSLDKYSKRMYFTVLQTGLVYSMWTFFGTKKRKEKKSKMRTKKKQKMFFFNLNILYLQHDYTNLFNTLDDGFWCPRDCHCTLCGVGKHVPCHLNLGPCGLEKKTWLWGTRPRWQVSSVTYCSCCALKSTDSNSWREIKTETYLSALSSKASEARM